MLLGNYRTVLVVVATFVGTANLLTLPEFSMQAVSYGGKGVAVIAAVELLSLGKLLFGWFVDTNPLMGHR